MKCLFCDSTKFKDVRYYLNQPELKDIICDNNHLLQFNEENETLSEGIWRFFERIETYPGRISHLDYYKNNQWYKYYLHIYLCDIKDINFIFNQQKTLKKERNISRTAWLLCSLRLRKWINRDIAKMIGVYLNRKPFYFWEKNEVSLL
jgi:hypothetical protein